MTHEPVDPTIIPQAILDRLDPDYRAFVESQPPASRVSLHIFQWSPAFRQAPPDLGQASPVSIGSTRTIDFGKFSVLVLMPDRESLSGGWPVLFFVHGGGWFLGNAETGIEFFSRACVEARCVAVSVDYRLALEHLFPAAVEDSWEALLWLNSNGEIELGVNTSKIAIMGVSSGANIATVIVQRASLAASRIPLVLQILLIPVLDLTFDHSNRDSWPPSMKENEHIFSLRAADLFWLRDLYTPDVRARTSVDASPLLQMNQAAFDGMAPAWVGVAELDVLRSEGEMYAEKLKTFGVPVTLKTYRVAEIGASHMLVVADRVSELARTIRKDQIEALKFAFAK